MKNNFMKRELIEEQEGRVTAMRSFLVFGFPIETDEKRYRDLLDEEAKQKEFVVEFKKEVYADIQGYAEDTDVRANIMSNELAQVQFNEIAKQDTAWAVFSVLFVFTYFVIHLRSLFLASIGVLIIMLAFGVTGIIN